MGNALGIEGGEFMSTGSLQSSSSREGSFKCAATACLRGLSALSPG
jgi:hypothetical protein